MVMLVGTALGNILNILENVPLRVSPARGAHRTGDLFRCNRSTFADLDIAATTFRDIHIESSARSFRSITNSTLIIYL